MTTGRAPQNKGADRLHSRRDVVAMIPCALALVGSSASDALSQDARPADTMPLREHARRRGLYFGSMINSRQLASDSALRQALKVECGATVPEVELKWGFLETQQGVPAYAAADSILDFARKNRMLFRAHTAAWFRNLPTWVPPLIAQDGGIDHLYSHVHSVVSHFAGRINEWDVVNEAIEPRDGMPGGLRNSAYYKAGGAAYIGQCFRVAHAADPHALLFYNDYGIEYADNDSDQKRRAVLDLLTGLKTTGAPIHGLGIQSHLKVGNRFEPRPFGRFLEQVAALGLKIVLTEFDVDDDRLPADLATRDAKVVDHARRYLDVALAQRAVSGMMTWGLSDRYSWLNTERARKDGLAMRALPLDEGMQRTPLWQAIAASLDSAPNR